MIALILAACSYSEREMAEIRAQEEARRQRLKAADAGSVNFIESHTGTDGQYKGKHEYNSTLRRYNLYPDEADWSGDGVYAPPSWMDVDCADEYVEIPDYVFRTPDSFFGDKMSPELYRKYQDFCE